LILAEISPPEMTPIPPQSSANLAILREQSVSSYHAIRRQGCHSCIQRASSLSAREWKHRLAGYGYAIRDTLRGQVVETLPHHVEVALLPNEAATTA